MSTEVRWRKGSTAEHNTFTGALAEVTVDTDKKTLVVHDGVTAGGNPLLTQTDISERVLAVGSVSDLTGLVGEYDGQQVSVKGYHAGSDVGGGIFYWDGTRTSENDGGTVIDGWVRLLDGYVTPEMFGVSSSQAPYENGLALLAAISTGVPVKGFLQAYTFEFDGEIKTYPYDVFDLDMGPHKHTFLSWGGVVANSCKVLRFNGRFTAGDGYCKGLGRFRSVEQVVIDVIEITDVFLDAPTPETQFFAVEYAGAGYGDNKVSLNCGTGVFKKIITKTPDFPSAVPATGFGNFGSSTDYVNEHNLHFDNLTVEDFYSVDPSDGVTVIGGDSDFFRLFTNPTQMTIDNLVTINVSKRFIKTQEKAVVHITNHVARLDSRFSPSNHNGTLEAQANNSGLLTEFIVDHANVDYPRAGTTIPAYFNANGLPHTLDIRSGVFKNLSCIAQNQPSKIKIANSEIDGLNINTNALGSLILEELSVTELRAVNGNVLIKDSSLSLGADVVSSGFPLDNATLYNVTLDNWDTNVRIAKTKLMQNVKVTYTRGTGTRRPFWPVPDNKNFVTGLEVYQTGGGTGITAFESPGGSGEMIIRDYRSSLQLGFFSSGTWDFVLDNCDSDVVTGAGVNSVVRASYV
jgi:hypothetical protein